MIRHLHSAKEIFYNTCLLKSTLKQLHKHFDLDYLRDIKEGSRAGAGPVEVPEPLPMPLVETPGPLPMALVETPDPPELDGGVGGCASPSAANWLMGSIGP